MAYSDDKQKASASYSLSTMEGIQQDMIQYGSVNHVFTVYKDFPTYSSSVHHHVSGSELGGHTIKTFGWSSEGGEEYRLVANPLNDQWGDHGNFNDVLARFIVSTRRCYAMDSDSEDQSRV